MFSDDIFKLSKAVAIDREAQELGVLELKLNKWMEWYKGTLNKFEKHVNDALTAAEQEQEGKVNLMEVQKKMDSLRNIVDIRVDQFQQFQNDVQKAQEEYTDTIAKERKKR